MAKLPTDKRAGDADVAAFLDKLKEAPVQPRAAGQRGRLIFAMDATASREPTWDKACHIQAEMFAETAVLGGLDVQLIYFRGFGECRASKWVPDATGLARLMSSVRCRGGHTQIGKVLDHAIKETKRERVHALVFVGDAMEEDIDHLCHRAGELGLLNLPLFAFQEGGDPIAAKCFRDMARLSGGAYCAFDSGSARQLRDLLSAVAVYAAGGRKAMLEFGKKRGGDVLRLTHQLGGKSG